MDAMALRPLTDAQEIKLAQHLLRFPEVMSRMLKAWLAPPVGIV